MSLCTMYGSYFSFYNQNQKAEMFFNEAINLGKQNKAQFLDSNLCEVYNDFSNYYKKIKTSKKHYTT